MDAKTVKKIVELGASVSLDCFKISWNDLVVIVKAAKVSNAKITLSHIPFSDSAMLELVDMAPGNLCIDLTRQTEWDQDED